MNPLTTSFERRVVVRALALNLEDFGGPRKRKLEASVKIEFLCSVRKAALEEPKGAPTPFAVLTGKVSVAGGAPVFTIAEPVSYVPPLDVVFEKDGHKRPRRKVELKADRILPAALGEAKKLELFLPDDAQIATGFAEISAVLTVDGSPEGKADENDVFDLPLLPLYLTHAMFEFVDGEGRPKKSFQVRVKSSLGKELEVESDDHGNVYLEASPGESFEVVEILPNLEEKLALVTSSSTEGFA